MAKVTIKLNRDGVGELLHSNEVRRLCEDYANKAVGRLGDGYCADTRNAQTRVYATVFAQTSKAKKDNLKNNTILKALR